MKKIICTVIILILCYFVYSINFNHTVKVIKYNGDSILVNIDNKSSDKLPTQGNYYLTSYKCGNKNTVVSWDNKNYKLSISNGNKKGGVSCNLNFKSTFLLSEASVGSYVKYVGNNGCINKTCSGVNANYVNDLDMGYCGDVNKKYVVSGFRIAYISSSSAYLISAGALECITRGASSSNVNLYVNDMNSLALKYCNTDYVYGGKCNNSSVWAMNDDDYQFILNKKINNCINSRSNMGCGYNNDLIDNGGYYFLSSIYNGTTNSIIMWNAKDRDISYDNYNKNYGLRPVIKMDNTVYVKGGRGTYEDPYIIFNDKEDL